MLASRAIHAAILHGGFNGVSEALWNGVPVIGLPQMVEQEMNICRVGHNKLGVSLEGAKVNWLSTLQSSVYHGTWRLSTEREEGPEDVQVFRFAGGAKRAADLRAL